MRSKLPLDSFVVSTYFNSSCQWVWWAVSKTIKIYKFIVPFGRRCGAPKANIQSTKKNHHRWHINQWSLVSTLVKCFLKLFWSLRCFKMFKVYFDLLQPIFIFKTYRESYLVTKLRSFLVKNMIFINLFCKELEKVLEMPVTTVNLKENLEKKCEIE